MVVFPECKINLGLNVLRKRTDGFHDLETCFFPVPWCDVLEVIPSDKFSFTLSGDSIPGNPSDNLCVKAYELLRKDFSFPAASIHLHKVIPNGAGLGGGSSDAAWTLRAINEVFQLKLDTSSLTSYASKLGSDCALFIHDQPMIGTGRGEILKPVEVDLKGKFLIIVKPDIHVFTAAAFAGVVPFVPERSVGDTVTRIPVHQWKELLRNDFEDSVFEKFPEIKSIKEQLYGAGAIYASMSGSGSAVFGIFDDDTSGTRISRIFTDKCKVIAL